MEGETAAFLQQVMLVLQQQVQQQMQQENQQFYKTEQQPAKWQRSLCGEENMTPSKVSALPDGKMLQVLEVTQDLGTNYFEPCMKMLNLTQGGPGV